MKILLAGGGTGGSVNPILAVAEEIKKLKPKTEFLFVGTKNGPEKKLVEPTEISFITIPAAKFRRYFSLWNIFDPFVLIFAVIKSFFIIKKFKPNIIFGVGSFVQVPLIWVGKLFNIKIVIHQQDARIGLANKLSSPFAHKITTAFEQTSKNFYSSSGFFTKRWKSAAEWVGNPFRSEIHQKHDFYKFFHLHENLPILYIVGGATGSQQINNLVSQSFSWLVNNFQVIHQTGKGKNLIKQINSNYHAFELLAFPEYSYIMQKANIVVCRAGLSTLTELSVLEKTSVIIPMPNSHQEDNADLVKNAAAGIVLYREDVTVQNFIAVLNGLRFDYQTQQMLAKNIKTLFPKDASVKLAEIIIKVLNE